MQQDDSEVVKKASEKPDLGAAIRELRSHAEQLPGEQRESALRHVEELEEHARREVPDTLRMRIALRGLEAFGELLPYISAAANALSNVGA